MAEKWIVHVHFIKINRDFNCNPHSTSSDPILNCLSNVCIFGWTHSWIHKYEGDWISEGTNKHLYLYICIFVPTGVNPNLPRGHLMEMKIISFNSKLSRINNSQNVFQKRDKPKQNQLSHTTSEKEMNTHPCWFVSSLFSSAGWDEWSREK